ERARSRRRNDRWNTQRTRKINCMQTTGATERQERKLSWIVPALDRDVSQCALHVCVCHRQHALSRRNHAAPPACCLAQIAREIGHSLVRALFVELELPTKQTKTAEVAQNYVCVSDGRQ